MSDKKLYSEYKSSCKSLSKNTNNFKMGTRLQQTFYKKKRKKKKLITRCPISLITLKMQVKNSLHTSYNGQTLKGNSKSR